MPDVFSKDPKDVTPEERSQMSVRDSIEIYDSFSSKYNDQIAEALKSRDGKPVTVIFCDGKQVAAYKDLYDMNGDDIREIEKAYGKICYIFSLAEPPEELIISEGATALP